MRSTSDMTSENTLTTIKRNYLGVRLVDEEEENTSITEMIQSRRIIFLITSRAAHTAGITAVCQSLALNGRIHTKLVGTLDCPAQVQIKKSSSIYASTLTEYVQIATHTA